MATPIACGWAVAVMVDINDAFGREQWTQKAQKRQKNKRGTDQLMDRQKKTECRMRSKWLQTRLSQVETSDAGSQYCCGRVDRGIQPRFAHQLPPHTQTYTKSIQNARFFHFLTQSLLLDGRTNTDQKTDGHTEKASYRAACPQLKRLTKTNNQEMFLESLLSTLSFHLSDRPSVSLFMSHVLHQIQYTQRHSPDASLPSRACFTT